MKMKKWINDSNIFNRQLRQHLQLALFLKKKKYQKKKRTDNQHIIYEL